ncbi:hypothetical protein ThrDRAFT_02793 [Frankia casuarinae]|nr:hypothetical protein CcI6DRAFT_02183 [Frankia sp. CcI6]EYT91554.1 hypothetical protein ThrDRAFT_02793 [Frankia casuarinae]KDA44834.1 hypothetical protein BMG523Draft_00358 [Frankia sp. BMG5.23]KFB04743.1 hypothetical protein ALLO2DRAFT_02464 [Frankia sp. Allo2]OHV55110.1 hypothetical protein CgIS1_11235 [Frankia sp. CgIS1]ORT51639.1 hypothetical protein KBI5_11080 [Frankia sp. KB5]
MDGRGQPTTDDEAGWLSAELVVWRVSAIGRYGHRPDGTFSRRRQGENGAPYGGDAPRVAPNGVTVQKTGAERS